MRFSSKILVAAASAALIAPSTMPVEAATEAMFAQNIGHLVDARLDPLVNPGSCSSHVHSIFGNALFGADITAEMLVDPTGNWRDIAGKYDTTTSELIPNLSMYWAPSLYIEKDGEYFLVPTFARPYYRITLRNDGDTSRIHPFPPFLRMILGDASRKTPWTVDETERDDIRWTLRTINRVNTNYIEHGDWTYLVANEDLAEIDAVELKLVFPECLATDDNDEPLTESPDWRSHAAYRTGYNNALDAFCPLSHPYQIPKLDLEVRYMLDPMRELLGIDHVNDVSNWIFSTGDTSGAGGHADFVSGWPTELMANMIANCTDATSRDGRECYLEQFDLDGREDKEVPYHGEVPLEQIQRLDNLIIGTDQECIITTRVPTAAPTQAPTSTPDCDNLSRYTCLRTAGCNWIRPDCVLDPDWLN